MPNDDALPEWEQVLSAAARLRRPVLILGSLDGIETGVRQLIRSAPLETQEVEVAGGKLTIPTEAEILRIKAFLILRRNATRDYLDFVALADHMGQDAMVEALRSFDALYPQDNGESPLQQLQAQLANPMPHDLDGVNLSEYKNLAARWRDWEAVKAVSFDSAAVIFDRITGLDEAQKPGPRPPRSSSPSGTGL